MAAAPTAEGPLDPGLEAIDLLLASGPVAERVRAAWVDRRARKGPGPSDHAPVIVDLDEGWRCRPGRAPALVAPTRAGIDQAAAGLTVRRDGGVGTWTAGRPTPLQDRGGQSELVRDTCKDHILLADENLMVAEGARAVLGMADGVESTPGFGSRITRNLPPTEAA